MTEEIIILQTSRDISIPKPKSTTPMKDSIKEKRIKKQNRGLMTNKLKHSITGFSLRSFTTVFTNSKRLSMITSIPT